MIILVLNAGSSSLKFSVFDARDERLLAEGGVDWSSRPTTLVMRAANRGETRHETALSTQRQAVVSILDELTTGDHAALSSPGEIDAVGHRVVHGGDKYTATTRVTAEVKLAIHELAELAPLHNQPSLEVIEAIEQLLPDAPQVAAFDTAFHATLSDAVRTYPLPRDWTNRWGLRRYGFHGLSHEYCSARAAELLGHGDLRLIIAHLGNGASISAVRDGVCVDTSMGFTPLEGLMMGTRSGSVDPGLLLYLLRNKGISVGELDHALNHESGLLGVSGLTSDMREILAAASHNPDARLALDMYVHRIQQTIGGMAATLGGVDGLVFTAGVGEHSPEIRRRVCENLGFLGVALDPSANAVGQTDSKVSGRDSKVNVLVIRTREDMTIVRQTRRLLESSEPMRAPGARPAVKTSKPSPLKEPQCHK